MDVREKLARLNPTTVKFDTGHGGVAELTNQDIAAALAFVPAGLGREVLMACWWADGAALSRAKLRDAVVALVATEMRKQWMRRAEAHTNYALAAACVGWSGAVTAEQRQARDVAEARLRDANAACWPRDTLEYLPNLSKVIIDEISSQPVCSECKGMPLVVAGKTCKCENCNGSGREPISDRGRAKELGIDAALFRRSWKRVYEWMLVRFRDAETTAAQHLAAALRREAA
ncbi:hypothetical protein [Stenotrophomonas maltophilia]|uniref:hypothetical protein n=1 Tax=Stenotrophomonas maltophilia TaxID=40324 RepID=UPI003BF781A7